MSLAAILAAAALHGGTEPDLLATKSTKASGQPKGQRAPSRLVLLGDLDADVAAEAAPEGSFWSRRR